jgi:hypothetical protein
LPPTTSPTPSRHAEPSRLLGGNSWSRTPWTAWPPGRSGDKGSPNRPHAGSHEPKKPAGKPVKPVGSVGIKNCRHGLGLGTGPVPNGSRNPASDDLRQQPTHDRCRLRLCDNPEDTDHAAAQPYARMQRPRGFGLEQLRTRVGAAPPRPNDGRDSTNSRRQGASSTKSWPSFTGSWDRTQSPATGSLYRWSQCKSSPVRETTSGGSTAQLLNNLEVATRRRRPEDVRVIMTDAPTRARTSTPTPMLMPCRSSGRHHRTSLLRPCCSVAVRRQ